MSRLWLWFLLGLGDCQDVVTFSGGTFASDLFSFVFVID